MIRKSGHRFSEKIVLKQKDRAKRRFDEKPSRSIHPAAMTPARWNAGRAAQRSM
jgi:hypothetical protein